MSEHIMKVKEGKYAYIAEKSLLEIMASKDCELHIAKEEFLPLQYGVGLFNFFPLSCILFHFHTKNARYEYCDLGPFWH
jgi:hypothetical protein